MYKRDIVQIEPENIKGKLCEALLGEDDRIVALLFDNEDFITEAVNNYNKNPNLQAGE